MTMATAIDAEVARKPKAARPDHVPPDRVVDIDLYELEGVEDGYHEAWKRLIPPGTPDLVWTPWNSGHWIATNGATIGEVYGTPSRFSSEVCFVPKEIGEVYQLVPVRMDPPEHTPYRKILDKGLNLARIRKVEDQIRTAAIALIERFLARGSCEFSSEYATIFPVQVFMAMADLPFEDAPLLGKCARQITRPEGVTPEEMAADLDAGNRGFFDYIEPYVRERTGGSGDDLISLMVNGTLDGEPIPHDKKLGLISLLLLAGLDTVVNFLSFVMIHLARHPELRTELHSDRAMLMRSAEEMFRRFPILAEARMVAHDQEYRGTTLKRGDMILLPTALHGLDDALNPDPMRLDPDRRSISHSTFAVGPHRCAGLHLARLEVIVTLEEWLKRIPDFHIKPGTTPHYVSGIVPEVTNIHLRWP